MWLTQSHACLDFSRHKNNMETFLDEGELEGAEGLSTPWGECVNFLAINHMHGYVRVGDV